jgi:hypothetical protein
VPPPSRLTQKSTGIPIKIRGSKFNVAERFPLGRVKAEHRVVRQPSPFTPTSTFYDRGMIDDRGKKTRLQPLNETEIQKGAPHGISPNLFIKDLRIEDPKISAQQMLDLVINKKRNLNHSKQFQTTVLEPWNHQNDQSNPSISLNPLSRLQNTQYAEPALNDSYRAK